MKQHKTEHKISTVGEDDFPELEGKVIIFNMHGQVSPGLVVGCNRSVGVTIVDADDKDEYLFCQRGPVAPGHIKGQEKRDKAVFEYTLQAIKDGVWDADEFSEYLRDAGVICRYSGGVSAASCAYAQ